MIWKEILMEMTQEHRQAMEGMARHVKCSKDFMCYKSGADNLCKARDFGMKEYIDCLEPEPHKCEFSLAFGQGYLCRCPLRIYIAKNLKQ